MNASTGDIGLASVAATAGSAIAAASDPNNTPRRDGVPDEDATSSSETARGTTARPRRALRRGPAKDAADASAIEGSITDVDIFARFSDALATLPRARVFYRDATEKRRFEARRTSVCSDWKRFGAETANVSRVSANDRYSGADASARHGAVRGRSTAT
jgi:hypothetical protein